MSGRRDRSRMKGSPRENRPTRREGTSVDDADDSDCKESVMKSGKRRLESTLPPGFDDLQEKVRKLEDNFKLLENAGLVTEGSERDELDVAIELARYKKLAGELDRRLNDVTTEKEAAVWRVNETDSKNRELAREKEALSRQVEDLNRRIGQGTMDSLNTQNKIKVLTQQLEMERLRANEDRATAHASIVELTYKLGEAQVWAMRLECAAGEGAVAAAAAAAAAQLQQSPAVVQPPQLLTPVALPMAAAAAAAAPTPPQKIVLISHIAHPTNVLQLYRAHPTDSIAFDKAVGMMRAKLAQCGVRAVLYLDNQKKVTLDCEVCEAKNLTNYAVIHHFIDEGHGEKVRASGAAVSFAAFQYWLRLLHHVATTPAAGVLAVKTAQPPAAPAAAPAPMLTQQHAAAAAPSGTDEAPKEPEVIVIE